MTGFRPGAVEVTVPATSANLGPGYDALGLALDLHDVVSAEAVDDVAPGDVVVCVEGEGGDTVPHDARHLVHRAMVAGFEACGIEPPGIRLHCRNRIPHGRGLGSSSAAIVAGLAAARGLMFEGTLRMDDGALFALAADIEGHPDNVAPAVYGGFTIAYAESGRFWAASLPVDERIQATVLIPSTPVETRVARGLIPASVPHTEAAANAGRAALLVAALTGRPDLLMDATEDWLHQAYRAPAMPQTLELVAELRAAGLAAVVSGAGPSVLVLSDGVPALPLPDLAPEGWRVLAPSVARHGVRVGVPS